MKNVLPLNPSFPDAEIKRPAVASKQPVVESETGPRYAYRLESSHLDDEELVRTIVDAGAQRSKAIVELLDGYEPAAFLICNLLIDGRAEAVAACEDACVEVVTDLLSDRHSMRSSFRVGFFAMLWEHCQRFASLVDPDANPTHHDYRVLLQEMSETERWVTVLRFVAGLNTCEIADVIRISPEKAKAELWSATQRILGSTPSVHA